MIVVVLRAFSPAFEVKPFLARFPGLQPDAIWQRGEKKPVRGVHEESGFTLTLVEAETGAQAVSEARQALENLAPALEALRGQSVSCLVDFGMFIGSERHFTGSVRWTSEDLQWFVARGLGLAASAYPTSDEGEEGEQA